MSVIRVVGYVAAGVLLGAANFGIHLVPDARAAALIIGSLVLVGTTLIDACD